MTRLALLVFLVPALAYGQPPQPYQSPATIAKQLKERCAALPPPQRPECEQRARGEINASIAKHHDFKQQEARAAAGKGRGGPQKSGNRAPQP